MADDPARSEDLIVRFCGGCNPHIDRAAVAAEVVDREGEASVRGSLYLSGCCRACASGHRLTLDGPTAVVVAGTHVDGIPTKAADVASAARAKLKE